MASILKGKRIALIGSGPGCLSNKPGFIDSHEVVVRVNNHKIGKQQGYRTDIHYSFYGASIRKTAQELKSEGVRLVMCKCPNGQFIDSDWHQKNNKQNGVDFSYIYRYRADWWFCDTYVPTLDEFMSGFNLLGGRVPTTGFSALLDLLSYEPESVYMTGFDFFASKIHNVNERWKPGDPSDPIGHAPEREKDWLVNADIPVSFDSHLTKITNDASRI